MGAPAPNPTGTVMQSCSEKWSEWDIQAVVVVSFGLQVILFFFAGMRRYSISSVLKVLLWLVYLSADAAAIYALGHMSATLSKTSTDKHQLVAFWAPFLLLHLGGQDTITAYALEDNKLWVRHLLNMFVQVTGTGYVLHKYIIADGATIVSAAVLVLVAGFVKYSERIWALKCASGDSDRDDEFIHDLQLIFKSRWFTKNEKIRTYTFMVGIAHKYRYRFVKPLITGRDIPKHQASAISCWITSNLDIVGLIRLGGISALEKMCAVEVYNTIEVQLAVMYDMLFTKAQVIHTWYGYLIRVISFMSCFGALVAFTRSKRDRYCTPDSVITFVLMGGACVLEVASAFKVIGSTWTYYMLRCSEWDWLACAILCARYHLIVVKDGRWSNSVGQYDFISLCCSDRTRLKRRMAGWIGLKNWWNRAHYTKHAKLSPALKQFIWGLRRGMKSDMVQIEDVAIRSGYWARKLTGFDQSEELDWSLRLDFQNCVFIWHLATNTFLTSYAVKSELVDTSMAEAVSTLSDYMMYLLVQHPDILPMDAAARSLFRKTHDVIVSTLCSEKSRCLFAYIPEQIILDYMEEGRCPDYIRDLCSDLTSDKWDEYPGEAVVAKASILVRTFLAMELRLAHKLVIIGRVWTEMLCYAATIASGDFHARQLSNGGEFLTHLLVLTKYCSGMDPIVQERYRAGDDQPVEVADPGKTTEDVAGHVELDVDTGSKEEKTLSR